jgi:hypothetical protein
MPPPAMMAATVTTRLLWWGRRLTLSDWLRRPVDRVERAVERHYARVRLSEDLRQRLRTQLDDLLAGVKVGWSLQLHLK